MEKHIKHRKIVISTIINTHWGALFLLCIKLFLFLLRSNTLFNFFVFADHRIKGDFDITIPRRIIMESDVLKSKSIHKRSIPSSNNEKDLLYSITAFNQTFYMHLTPKNDFIAPHFVLEYQRKSTISETWIQSHNQHKSCYHTGKVDGDPNSVVSVSICNYMVSKKSVFLCGYKHHSTQSCIE